MDRPARLQENVNAATTTFYQSLHEGAVEDILELKLLPNTYQALENGIMTEQAFHDTLDF